MPINIKSKMSGTVMDDETIKTSEFTELSLINICEMVSNLLYSDKSNIIF